MTIVKIIAVKNVGRLIQFLTKPKMLVSDPFGGSSTTGATAEKVGRRWAAVEPNVDYITASRGRSNGKLKA
jgi:site-specific DNA-methyltransferase (cytosine-N4-specific)